MVDPSKRKTKSKTLSKSKSSSKSKSKSRKTKNQKGGEKYKEIWCSQSIVGIPRGDCSKKYCTGNKKYKDGMKKLSKLNYEHDKFVAKTCNIKFDKYGVYPETDEEYKCNSDQRKGKLFETILKLEKDTSIHKCLENNCAKGDKMADDCMDLGEQLCRIKYKDVIENVKKTKKQTILPLEECM